MDNQKLKEKVGHGWKENITRYQEFCTTAYCPYCKHDVLEHNNESKTEKKGCRLCRAIEISPDKECGYTESQLFQEWKNKREENKWD